MDDELPLPREIWDRTPPEAQALILLLGQALARIEVLERQVAELESQLEGKGGAGNGGGQQKSKPEPKRAPPKSPSGRRRGGQQGHPRHARPLVPSEQAQAVTLKPNHCGECGGALAGADPTPRRHQVAEVPPITPQVTEYQLHCLDCPRCGARTSAKLPAEVRGHFGVRLTALLSLLAGSCRLSKRAIRRLARDAFGLDISLGMISKLERGTSAALAPVHDELLAAARRQR